MVPDQRTLIVLGSLVAGMTLISSLLLVLEPGPVAPLSGTALQSLDRASGPEDKLFNTTASHRPWKALVIHDSGTLQGSSETLNHRHEQLGRGGLGYHFVINNGQGAQDGLIEVGFRWKHQRDGAYLAGQGADWFNTHAIGICLIGDIDRASLTDAQLRELVWLVQQLQRRFDIPSEQVYVDLGSNSASSTSQFPHLWFREHLLSANLP